MPKEGCYYWIKTEYFEDWLLGKCVPTYAFGRCWEIMGSEEWLKDHEVVKIGPEIKDYNLCQNT